MLLLRLMLVSYVKQNTECFPVIQAESLSDPQDLSPFPILLLCNSLVQRGCVGSCCCIHIAASSKEGRRVTRQQERWQKNLPTALKKSFLEVVYYTFTYIRLSSA